VAVRDLLHSWGCDADWERIDRPNATLPWEGSTPSDSTPSDSVPADWPPNLVIRLRTSA
jgi:hypothetical protein